MINAIVGALKREKVWQKLPATTAIKSTDGSNLLTLAFASNKFDAAQIIVHEVCFGQTLLCDPDQLDA